MKKTRVVLGLALALSLLRAAPSLAEEDILLPCEGNEHLSECYVQGTSLEEAREKANTFPDCTVTARQVETVVTTTIFSDGSVDTDSSPGLSYILLSCSEPDPSPPPADADQEVHTT